MTKASIGCVMFACLTLSAVPMAGQDAPERYALLIGGLGGTDAYTRRFQEYLVDTHRALIQQAGFKAENVTVLAERTGDPAIDDSSTAENIRARFEHLSGLVHPQDMVLVVLFGHGSFDGRTAYLNIPRRDLSATDYSDLLGSLKSENVVLINTASASGPFAEQVGREGRAVITATRTGTQRNETSFPAFVVEAISGAGDIDRDGNLSVREVFAYAAEKTLRKYTEAQHIATEDPMLDDDGDGRATRFKDLDAGTDGVRSAVMYLKRSDLARAYQGIVPAEMLQERVRLERAVADLKLEKAVLDEAAYYRRLEALFIQLAQLNERIESGLAGQAPAINREDQAR